MLGMTCVWWLVAGDLWQDRCEDYVPDIRPSVWRRRRTKSSTTSVDRHVPWSVRTGPGGCHSQVQGHCRILTSHSSVSLITHRTSQQSLSSHSFLALPDFAAVDCHFCRFLLLICLRFSLFSLMFSLVSSGRLSWASERVLFYIWWRNIIKIDATFSTYIQWRIQS